MDYAPRQVDIWRCLPDGIRYKVLDFHVHSLPRRIKGSRMWLWSIPWEGDVEELICHMDGAGVQTAVVLPYSSPKQLRLLGLEDDSVASMVELNNLIAAATAVRPDRLIGFARVLPKNDREVIAEIERIAAMGFRGIGHFDLRSYVTGNTEYALLDKVADLGLVVEVAAYHELFDILPKIAEAYKGVKFKVSNFCLRRLHEKDTVSKALKGLEHENVYADIATSLTFQPSECMDLLQRYGYDRFVYGSDFPTVPYDIEHDLTLVETYHSRVGRISSENWLKLFWNNSAEMLGLPQIEGAEAKT